ncbi:MAG: LamG domain-containing protein [Gemmataceae bacterium]
MFFSFDEGKGEKIKDLGLYKLDGNLHKCKWVKGVNGTALEFNGIDSYAKLSSHKILNFDKAEPFTISGWIKTTTNGAIFSMRKNPDRGSWAIIDAYLDSGKLKFWVRPHGDPFSPLDFRPAPVLTDGKWHHFALGRMANGSVFAYVDGRTPQSTFGPFGNRPKVGGILTNARLLGKASLDRNNHEHHWFGSLDELAIHNRVLSEAEVIALAKQGGIKWE